MTAMQVTTLYRTLTVTARPRAVAVHDCLMSEQSKIATLHPLARMGLPLFTRALKCQVKSEGVSPTSLSGKAAKSVETLAMTL